MAQQVTHAPKQRREPWEGGTGTRGREELPAAYIPPRQALPHLLRTCTQNLTASAGSRKAIEYESGHKGERG